MKKSFDIYEVSIVPDEVEGVQRLECGAIRIDMSDSSSVVVPKAIYEIIRPDIEKALLRKLEGAVDSVIHVLFVM